MTEILAVAIAVSIIGLVCGSVLSAMIYNAKLTEKDKQLSEARKIISDLIELGKIWLEESDDDYEFIKRSEQYLGDEK